MALNKLTSCSINLSGLSLSDESFLEFVEKTLDTTGFPCKKLCFEITETAAITNLDRANAFIIRLKQKGCRFALDDFGSGLSSYGYLKNLSVDVIKIDGGFIRNIENNEIDRAVVKSICDIGSLMDKKITAEYVESKESLEILHQLNVDYVQGNYLAPPLPIALAVLGDHRDDGDKKLSCNTD
jgi:EAL domain-containing protein (putative c-di-GMP-specific phosphodiesterase class I)